MATALVSAAFSVVGKALAPLTDGLLKDWAASVELGHNVNDLELELLSTKAVLEHTIGKDIADNAAFRELLVRLQDLGYDADDVLDELDYFRIQDQLDGTSAAADRLAKGFVHNKALHAKAVVGKKCFCLPACFSPGKCFPCSSSMPCVRDVDNSDDNRRLDNSPQRNHTNNEPPKLRFNRIEASKRMQLIVGQLRLVKQEVSGIIAALGPCWSTAPNIAQSRLITTSDPIEPKLYGRDLMMSSIVHDITEGKHSGNLLTVIPIVGPGGIRKTTLAQHIYHNEKVQEHFEVKVWKCVSLKFNANNLLDEIKKHIPQVKCEKNTSTAGELIGQRLNNRRFLLVLDDIWDCSNEDEWERLLVPFKKSQVQGNIIIATTRFLGQAKIMIRNIAHPMTLHGLEHDEFMELFLDFIFDDDQPREAHTFLLETGDKIAHKLKGSPLAAKTVGRMLKRQLDLAHWTRVEESKEWEQSNDENEIMPALKLSYDYLPLHLKQCFYYCALFPQDYKFQQEKLINFWIGLNVLHSSCGENERVEDIGRRHLSELVNHGIFEKGETNGSACYILHDLLHELARKVSSHECFSIDSSQSHVRSLRIPPSIRHLSIIIDDTSVEDRLTLKHYVENFNTLGKRLKVEKLRTLMLFGKHQGRVVKVFGDLFREAKALRVVFLSEASYDVKELLHNFYNLVHLRYLRIQSCTFPVRPIDLSPTKLSKFHHIVVIDVQNYCITARDMGNLVKLRHFLVDRDDKLHSSIVEVGKLKSLQELRRFIVKQEGQGFELRQIGDLVELCGSLCIASLQNVQAKEEANEAKLMQKSRLHELLLCWDMGRHTNDDSAIEEQVLERLKPNNNLPNLSIIGNKGDTCPSWLGTSLSVKNLESLYLYGVAWKTFPPIGELCLVNVSGEEIPSIVPQKRFENLRRLVLKELPQLNRWAVHAPCQLFPFLEVIEIQHCSNLVELSFSHSTCCRQEKLANGNLFPNKLSSLKIKDCPQLSSFSTPLPWTKEATCCIEINRIGSPRVKKMTYLEVSFRPEYSLTIHGNHDPDSTFWNVLAFHNLTKLKAFNMGRCPPLPLHHLQMLSSLRKLSMSHLSNGAFPFVDGDNHSKYQLPVEELEINPCRRASGKKLTQLLTYFPKLSELMLRHCEKVTRLGVMGQQATAIPSPSSSANKLDEQRQQQDSLIALEEDGLLLLPPQLQVLWIHDCQNLSLCSPTAEAYSRYEPRIGGGGLQGMNSLRRLSINSHPIFLYLISSSVAYYPSVLSQGGYGDSQELPNSLEDLSLLNCKRIETLPLSNLSSLTRLNIEGCDNLRGQELLSLLAQGHLTELFIKRTPNFFVDSDPSRVHEQEFPPCSSKLQSLDIDDVAGVTAAPAPICRLLVSSLTRLWFDDMVVERFTEEQEILLFVNSLELIGFEFCMLLQYLPARLHKLPNLKRLEIRNCKAIRMLPKGSLPSSLQELEIWCCPEIRSLPKDGLPSSLQKLVIIKCPAIQSLPKVDDLPSSLRELDIEHCGNEELKRQCRRLIGIIPIVRTD